MYSLSRMARDGKGPKRGPRRSDGAGQAVGRPARSALDLVAVVTVSTVLAAALVFVEPVRSGIGSVSGWPTDGLLTLLVIVPAVAIFLSWRRWHEVSVMQREVARRAARDPLTGLFNRKVITERLVQSLGRSRTPTATRPAVLCCGIDRFRRVNDTYGRDVADGLLVTVADRLAAALRKGDTLGRLGGDVFVAVCPVVSAKEAATVAERILAAFDAPFAADESPLRLTASVGVAVPDGIVGDHDGLLRSAEHAMVRAKAEGGGRAMMFQPSMQPIGFGSSEERLRQAFSRDEFCVLYQPVVSAFDGRVMGVEALLRWLHPERGIVPPEEFMPLLEECGLIVPVGRWLLDEACRQARRWRDAHPSHEPVRVTVDVTARQLAEPDFRMVVSQTLAATGARPSQLCLEITEAALTSDNTAVWGRLRDVKSLGVGLAVDDFGTGLTSLSFVRRYSVDMIKVDESFVAGLTDYREDRALVAAIVGVANGLGLRCVAEGVETPDQLTQLRALGCELVQGRLISRPVVADVIDEMLQADTMLATPPVSAPLEFSY